MVTNAFYEASVQRQLNGMKVYIFEIDLPVYKGSQLELTLSFECQATKETTPLGEDRF